MKGHGGRDWTHLCDLEYALDVLLIVIRGRRRAGHIKTLAVHSWEPDACGGECGVVKEEEGVDVGSFHMLWREL